MKSLKALMILLAGCMLASCDSKEDSDDEIITGCGIGESLLIMIKNESGDNLLDPSVEGSLAGKFEAYATVEGKTYSLDWSLMDHPDFDLVVEDRITEYKYIGRGRDRWLDNCPFGLPPMFRGFIYYVQPYFICDEQLRPEKYMLTLGDFHWPNSWREEIHLSFPSLGKEYDIIWTTSNNRNTQITCNGEKVDNFTLYITVP